MSGLVTTGARDRVGPGDSEAAQGRATAPKSGIGSKLAKGFARLVAISFYAQAVSVAFFVVSSLAGGEGSIPWGVTGLSAAWLALDGVLYLLVRLVVKALK